MDDGKPDASADVLLALEQARIHAEEAREDLQQRLTDTAKELDRCEARFTRAERLAAFGYWEADLRSGQAQWSTGLSQLLGHSAASRFHAAGDLAAAIHPDDRPALARAVADAGPARPGYDVDVRLQDSQGNPRHVHIRGELVFDTDGCPVGSFGIAQAALRACDAHACNQSSELELIYRTAPVGLCVLDRDLRFVRINERLAEINGLPPEAHLGRTVREVVPEVARRNEALLRKVLATGEPVLDFEVTATTPAQPGVQRTWLSQYWPLRDENGAICGINVVAEEITDRRRLERVRQQEREFRALAENSSDVIVRFDRAHRRIYVNPAIEALVGKPREAMLGKTNREAGLPPALADFLDHAIEQVFTTGQACTLEVGLPTPAGERVVDSRLVPEFGPADQVETVLGISRDVTERRRAEEALRESERKYRTLVENLYEGIWLIDEHDHTTFVNTRMTELLGYSAEEMLGRDLFSFMDERAVEAARRELAGCRGRRAEYELEFRHKDGAALYTHITTAPLHDAQGNYRGVLAGVVDITARRKAEEALQRREREFEALAERAPDIIARVDAHHRISYVNPAVERLTGYPRAWFLHKTVCELDLPEEEKALRERVLRRVFETGEEQVIEHEFAAGENKRYFQARLAPEFGAHGKVVSVLVVDRDITDLKRAQFALETLTLHDPLTQIPNRRYLEQFIGREWGREVRHGHRVAVIMADIDHFKAYNDRYGHQRGDDCLRQVAQTLRACLRRPTDFLVRYGGEEFAVVLLEADLPAAVHMAESMRRAVLDRRLPHAASPSAPVVTLSLGVSAAPAASTSFPALLGLADEALYRAKRNGRNRVELAE
ncbi:MAG: PAS domain S-box protein [Thiohalomonadaceae bacterium]